MPSTVKPDAIPFKVVGRTGRKGCLKSRMSFDMVILAPVSMMKDLASEVKETADTPVCSLATNELSC